MQLVKYKYNFREKNDLIDENIAKVLLKNIHEEKCHKVKQDPATKLNLPQEIIDKIHLKTNFITAIKLNSSDYVLNKLFNLENHYFGTINKIINLEKTIYNHHSNYCNYCDCECECESECDCKEEECNKEECNNCVCVYNSDEVIYENLKEKILYYVKNKLELKPNENNFKYNDINNISIISFIELNKLIIKVYKMNLQEIISIIQSLQCRGLRMYAKNYNILRILGGYGGVCM